ncbi:hypothetical protein B0T22DRAFT_421016 [Podospora appendiculata]|uniref:Glycosyltransferase Family 1 n=1 Tax=Podospora appendiculata TaxID=314037 RepID=A0AAE1CGK5_9PEZI|nr:hypothetical protein B0T22DRAFT_421016 [Podospora appendiculata]
MTKAAFGKAASASIADRLDTYGLGAGDEPPPAYGEHVNRLQLSQSGFEAGAAVTSDGRVNININQKNRRLADLLAPTLRSQLASEAKPPSEPLPPAYIPPSLGGQPGQTPPPKLNVVIQIVGSRGDVQPFVALGQVLRDTYGHRVRIATHPTFQKFVEENGLEFFSIGGDPAELMAFMVKNPGLMPGIDALKSGEITKRRQGIEQIILGCWRSCIEAGNGLGPPPRQHRADEPLDERNLVAGDPQERPFVADAIIANPPSFAHIHIAEKLGIPLHMTFTMPWSPTRAFPHPLANIESTNTDVVMTNYVSYALVEMMTWQGLGDVINRFRTRVLDLEPLSLIWAPGVLNRLRIPTTYCWSSALIPKPSDWAPEISISGFYFLNLASSYTPEPDLAAFLAAGPPPVYIGFGSIVVEDPTALTRTILDAISIAGVRALVSKGWGGLGADSVGIPEGVFMLGNCPHDWLFQHVSAVVHHGGAGTSAVGIKLGKPTVVVPFFGDQPFWGAMIQKAGAGPAPIPYKKMTAENLAAAIREAIKPETQARAQELGAKIREEKGADIGGKSFHEFLNTDNMRCSLAPSRVAVWRVRRTKTRLSSLAAAVLVNQGILKYSDIKLYRSIEYNTDEQPWDPVSAVTSALVGDIGTMAMAVGDFPREFYKGVEKRCASGTATPTKEDTPGDLARSSSSSTQLGAQSDAASVSSSSRPSVPIGESGRSSPRPSATEKPSVKSHGSSAAQLNLEAAIDAGKGVTRIVDTGVKMPMNFCLGLARGFRNAPKLYSDDTVRPTEKVTDFASGLRVASKEFGYGLFDGISGLVTQPLRGAEKEGGIGLLKGFGKGIGGLILKPSAAIWSVPAYTMQGVHAEVRSMFSKSSTNFIIAARVLQGNGDLESSSVEEQKDIITRWQVLKGELKGFRELKQKENAPASFPKGPDESNTAASRDYPDDGPPPKTGWLHTRNLSLDERRKLHAQKDAWKARQAGPNRLPPPPLPPRTPSETSLSTEDEEFERAIRESVQQTSRGDREEDARVEANIRASVKEMRRIAEQERGEAQNFTSAAAALPVTMLPGDEDLTDITDEEYQALIEEAVRRSLSTLSPHTGDGEVTGSKTAGASGQHQTHNAAPTYAPPPAVSGSSHEVGEVEDEDEDLRRAMEESELEHKKSLDRQKTEEEIVLEYVKKQSLAEQEHYRKLQEQGAQKGKGGMTGEDIDEDLRRALEESLKGGNDGHGGYGDGAGPSS